LVSDLSNRWRLAFPDLLPIGHQLRGGEHWVRFHTLPGSKRYADDEHEYGEILYRHRTLLARLRNSVAGGGAPGGDDLYVVTPSWSGGATPAPRSASVARTTPAAEHWQSICTTHPEDIARGDEPMFTHLFVDCLSPEDAKLTDLLRLVADDRTGDVIISDRKLNWLYHPYDGGADIITRDPAVISQLRHTFHEWLPTNPAGL
jgi:hypothetical protein